MPPLVRLRSAVSLLIVSLAVNCHAISMQGQQLIDNSVVMTNPVMPSDEDMKFFVSESRYRQHSLLFFNKTRPPPLEPRLSSNNILAPAHSWTRYFTTDGMFQDLQLADRNGPVIRLSSKAVVDAFRQGDWVNLDDEEQLADPQEPRKWVRCQHNSTSPGVMVSFCYLSLMIEIVILLFTY